MKNMQLLFYVQEFFLLFTKNRGLIEKRKFSIAEATIKSKVDIEPQDETMALLQQAQVDHSERLRFRITERFNTLLKAIYEERKQTRMRNYLKACQNL